VNLCLAHLILETDNLVRWREWIVSAGADEYASLHPAGFGRRLCRENTVHTDDSLEVGTIARELKHNRTAETEPS
jgi:hypothetical protein